VRVYEYLAEHPEDASHFNAAMMGYHGEEPSAIVEAYNFSGSGERRRPRRRGALP
jgi:hypothetical protein